MNTVARKDNSGMSHAPSTRPFGSLISNLFGQDMNRWFDDDVWGLSNRITRDTVPVNIRETDKTYEVEVMAPGLKKSDFKVALDGKQLTVSFEHQEQNQEGSENESYLRREFKHQSFTRNFTLDDSVDAAKIAATYTDGVLHLTVPKKEDAQRISRTVEVK